MNRHLLSAAILGLLIGGAASAHAAACAPGEAATKYPSLAGKTIRMGVDPQTPPYAERDEANPNTLVGSDIDLAKAVFDCVGLKYEFVPGAWSGLLPAIVSGQIDMMAYLYYNPKRAEQADFVIYQQAGTGALVQKGNPAAIHSNDDLCGKRVAVALGSVEEAQMGELTKTCTGAGKAAIEIMTYPDNAAGFRLLQNDRADMVMNDLALIDSTAKKQPAAFERAYSIVSGFELGLAAKKGNDELTKALFDGLQGVQAAGGQVAILTKFGIDPTLASPAVVKTK